jgi:beta-xylosidase
MKKIVRKLSFVAILPIINILSVQAQKATNPIIFADVPDISIIHVGDNYYMSSTTMHMSPGVPIMKSKDLVNWQLVSYAYDTLADIDELNLNNGKSTYGRGSWASSIRYHKGTYFVSTFAQTTGRTHVYTTKNIEKGPWKAISFKPSYHDHSLFFDDDGRVYLIYGVGKLRLVELNADVSGVKPGTTEQVIVENAMLPSGGGPGLQGEGSQLFKYKGKYYLFNITWPRGGMRTVVIHRADKITGPYEGRLGLQDLGVAQGGMIDAPDGSWYAYLFRDFGSVGRIPYLVPIKWEDGWPVIGINGKVPETLDLPAKKRLIPGIVNSDDFTRKKGEPALPLVWQWNHNPDNKFWSVTQRPGFLRLTTGRIDTSILLARNMLTQRTIGPVSTGSTSLDVSHMKEGDFAGLCLLQKNYGLVGVRLSSGTKSIVMINAGTGKPVEVQTIPLTQNKVFFKAECDFTNKKDTADFFYSLDDKTWTPIGTPLKMSYTLPHFMGYRFGLFNYATKNTGGYVDFDYFHISDVLIRKN